MKTSMLTLAVIGIVAGATVCAQEQAQFTFYSRGQERYFELRLPERCYSSADAPVCAQLGERSPEIRLAYPSQISPYTKGCSFAGIYGTDGRHRLEVRVVRYGPERITEEQVVAEADFPSRPPEMPADAWRRYAAAQADECERVLRRDPHAAFHQYVTLLAAERAGIPLQRPGQPMPRWLRVARRPVDLYSITTGALAVQETLQLEGMTEAYEDQEEAEYPIGELEKVEVRSHPFQQMLEGKRPVVCDMARAVPQDFYYCRFRTMDDLLKLFEFMEQWGNHLLRTYGGLARDDHLADKYMAQMLLQASPLTRELFRRIQKETAIVGSDPFFLSGTDVTLVMRTDLATALTAHMNQKVEQAAAARPDLTMEEVDWLGVKLQAAHTPDRTVSCVFGQADGFCFIGNSLPAVRRVVSALRGEVPSLNEALDFRYMRTVYPADSAEENGFIYLSEAFLTNLVGPSLKIREQRRMRCVNGLRMMEHGALLFEVEKGRRPLSLDELKAAGYLSARAPRCPDGGTYSLDPACRTASCSVHNRLPYLTPHVGGSIEMVTGREARDYNQFAWQYNSYWRTYFDPIGVRISLGPVVRFETCILPLIENSIYNEFSRISGGEAVNLNGPLILPDAILTCGGRVRLAAGLGESGIASALKQHLGEAALQCLGNAFEDEAFLVICDGKPLYDYDVSGFVGEALRSGLREWLAYVPVLAGLQLPSYSVLKIKDRAAFDQFLAGVNACLADEAAEKRFGRFAVHLDFSELPGSEGRRVFALGAKLFSFGTQCYYAALGDYLYVANRLDLMHRLMEAEAEAARAPQPPLTGNMAMRFLPGNWRQIRGDMALSWEVQSRQACFANFALIEPFLQAAQARQPAAEVQEEGGRRTYFCPDSGSYNLKNGKAFCSAHGHPDDPRQSEAPVPTGRIAELLERCAAVTLRLSFTEHGIATEVTVTQTAPGTRGRAR